MLQHYGGATLNRYNAALISETSRATSKLEIKISFPGPSVLNPDSDAPRLDLCSLTCTGGRDFSDNNLQNLHLFTHCSPIDLPALSRSVCSLMTHMRPERDGGRIPSTHRHTYSSTVPGRALVRWLDTAKEAIHQPVVFLFFLPLLGRASPGSAGESVMLWLPFIKRQGYCGSGSTGAAAINKQTKREGLMNTTRLPSGSRNGEQDKGRGGGRETVSMLQDWKQTLTKKILNKTWNILERLSLPPRAQRRWHKEMSSKALITYIPQCVSKHMHTCQLIPWFFFFFFSPFYIEWEHGAVNKSIVHIRSIADRIIAICSVLKISISTLASLPPIQTGLNVLRQRQNNIIT